MPDLGPETGPNILPMSPSWSQQQNSFAAALADADIPVPCEIRKTAGKPSTRRFGVYRNGGSHTLVEVLSSNFPVISALIGDENFTILARNYMVDHLPKTPVMSEFGDQLADYIADFAPLRDHAYMKDVAQLERLWLVAYNAAEGPTVGIESLGAIDPERLGEVKFTFHPSLGLVSSPAPIASIWFAHQDCEAGVDLSSLPQGGEDVLVTRPHAEVELRRLPPGAAKFIEALKDGAALGEAAESASEFCEDFDMATAIGGLFEAGAVMELSMPS